MEGSEKRSSLDEGRSLRSLSSLSPKTNLIPSSIKSVTGSSELNFPSDGIVAENVGYENIDDDINALPSSVIINKDAKSKGKEQEQNTRRVEKTAADCLNLVSKTCFRKVPPSSFYTFFPRKSSHVEYPRSAVSDEKDKSTSTAPVQKGILHDDKLFDTLNEPVKPKVVGFGGGNEAHDSKIDAPLIAPLDGEKEVNRKSNKKEVKKHMGNVPSPKNMYDSVFSGLSQVDGTPLPEKQKSIKKESSIGDAEKKKKKKKKRVKTKATSPKTGGDTEVKEQVTAEHLQIAEGLEDEIECIGLNEVILQRQTYDVRVGEPHEGNETHGFDEGAVIGFTQTASDELEVWRRGRIVEADEAGASPPVVTEAPVVVVTGRVSETSEHSSSSSSSSGTDSKNSVAKPSANTEEADQKEAQPLPIPMPPSPPKTNLSQLSLSQSFSVLGVSASFMTQGGGSTMYPLMKSGSEVKLNEEFASTDVLQAVSSCTVLLLKTYSAMIEHKSDEEWAPIRDLMSTMSYDELTSRRPSLLRDEINDTKMKDETDHEKTVELDSVENVIDSMSSIMMGSDVTPSNGSSSLDLIKGKLLPDKFSEIDFMKYFCSDWGKPSEKIASTERGPEGRAAGKGQLCSRRVSEALEQIDPDATYDVIFTYKLPKTAPFDLNDSLADVRFNRVQKWLSDTANAIYTAFFDSEIKGKSEEKYIKELLERLFALQEKVNDYEDLRKNPKPKIHSPSVLSRSTFGTHSSHRSEGIEEEESPGELSDHPSDSQIESALVELKVKLDHSHMDDSEVMERRTACSADTDEHQPPEKSSQSNVSMHTGTGSRRYTSETRGSRKRREIKDLVEQIIAMLEKKLKRLEDIVGVLRSQETEDNENSVEAEPSPTDRGAQLDESYIPRTERLATTSQDNLIQEIEAKLKRDFFIEFEPKIKSKKMEKGSSGSPQISSENTVEVPTCQQRLRLYMLGLTDTWRREVGYDESSSSGLEN